MITIKNVSKNYGHVTALKDFSAVINKGEITGILGPNGAGKTTLLKIITCYMYPTSGEVIVDNFDIYNQSLKIREMIGYLPENAPLYSDLTVLDYLKFIASVRNIPKEKIMDRIQKVSDECDIRSVAYKRIDALSKGYRQRVGLAQALIHDPEILILDEPTSGLDPNQILEVRELIKQLGKMKTMLFSSHILQEVQAVCDRAIIINKGEIVGDGDPESMSGSSSGSKELSLTVKAHDDILHDLKSIYSVIEAERKSSVGGLFSYSIKFDKDSDIRDRIFDECVRLNAKIVEMKLEKDSLEKVFRELTL
ncbi:MAG TPA: ATP-binding cassette domain-containing protein [Clostridiales bacterium]|jgi:ABC-2 type transport system ATP-binding protein|nr:ATP-binding cassette domain-containing protein [Clostridiales bacterium]HQP69454.1 ATP-binding cassette domain-containing protein [Clostridiales bacterium]